jgi:hypothetical protein
MEKLILGSVLPALIIIIVSCTGQNNQERDLPPPEQTGKQQVADQIIYDVVIKNHDPEDDWTEKCLAGLKRQELVDFLLDGIYNERFKAFDIFSDKAIPVRKVRKMEENGEFSREQVSKMQFVEEWYIDPENFTMSKRVTEVRLGIEHFDNHGLLLGHNPLFKIKLIPYP